MMSINKKLVILSSRFYGRQHPGSREACVLMPPVFHLSLSHRPKRELRPKEEKQVNSVRMCGMEPAVAVKMIDHQIHQRQ